MTKRSPDSLPLSEKVDEPGRKSGIITVDDNPATIDMVRTALKNEGVEIMVATSGQ